MLRMPKLTGWVTRFTRVVNEAEVIPRGYGYCRPMIWRQDCAMFAVIPLNFVLGAWHWFYWRVLVQGCGWRRDPYQRLRQYWIDEGRRRGYNEGYEAGVRHTVAAREVLDGSKET